MTYGRENPFTSAQFRYAVAKDDFIGHEDDLRYIEHRFVLPPPEYQRGSVAIIGLPDVGKYCLVHHALLTNKARFYRKRLIPIEIDLRNYTGIRKHDDFFRDLIFSCKEELGDEDLALAPAKIENMLQKAKAMLQEWDNGPKTISSLKGFFGAICRAGIQVMFILNNFDHADSLFKEHIERIQWLRDLAGAQCQITWIVLSCKPIKEIKTLPKSLSDDFFSTRPLGMFRPEDMIVYFRLLIQAGVLLTEEHKKRIIAYCGRHPYLLSLLGFHLVEDYAYKNTTIDVEHTFKKVEEKFEESYERIINLILVNDGNNEKLQILGQILIGAVAGIEQKDIDRMRRYGLISDNSARVEIIQPAYVAFSEHFKQYLLNKLTKNKFSLVQEKQESAQDAKASAPWNQTMYPGEIYHSRFKILEKLASTGHSQVMKAYDDDYGRFVALKCLYVSQIYDEQGVKSFGERLKREAVILRGIEPNNIGEFYEFIEDPPMIVMEWIDGKSLEDILKRKIALSKLEAIEWSIKVVKWGIKLAEVLVSIHTKEQPIIHRDIKPANIIIRSEDDEPILIDFDIARIVGGNNTIHPLDQPVHTLRSAGTPGYMPPEQVHDPLQVTDRVDIYALGVVLYEALTKKIPDPVPPQCKLPQDPAIPASLRRILQAMLSKEPQGRPDAKKLCQQLISCSCKLKKG